MADWALVSACIGPSMTKNKHSPNNVRENLVAVWSIFIACQAIVGLVGDSINNVTMYD